MGCLAVGKPGKLGCQKVGEAELQGKAGEAEPQENRGSPTPGGPEQLNPRKPGKLSPTGNGPGPVTMDVSYMGHREEPP